MKTASIRDLRNRFPVIAGWIEDGEEVVVTRRSKAFARLVPEQPTKATRCDWADSAAAKLDRTKRKPLSAKQAATLIKESATSW